MKEVTNIRPRHYSVSERDEREYAYQCRYCDQTFEPGVREAALDQHTQMYHEAKLMKTTYSLNVCVWEHKHYGIDGVKDETLKEDEIEQEEVLIESEDRNVIMVHLHDLVDIYEEH